MINSGPFSSLRQHTHTLHAQNHRALSKHHKSLQRTTLRVTLEIIRSWKKQRDSELTRVGATALSVQLRWTVEVEHLCALKRLRNGTWNKDKSFSLNPQT